MKKNAKIYIAGNSGMVGSAIFRNLQSKGFVNFVFTPWPEYDLTNQLQTQKFFEKEKPEYVFLAAAKVGGINANNTYRAQFIYENLMIQNNIIHSAYKYSAKKLLFLGSSCIYPKHAPQPLKEEYLLSGKLEQTNEPYAIAKIAGIKMCENYFKQYGCNFISVMPTNLYGPNDNYDLENSHVLPALIRKMHLGKCLEQNNWDALFYDLNKRPIEGINGSNSEAEIRIILGKNGINSQRVSMKEPLPLDLRYSTSGHIFVTLWGSGNVYREFLHVDDMADACVYIMVNVEAKNIFDELDQTHVNIGTGEDLKIKKLATIVKKIIGYNGKIIWDTIKPDGTLKKQLDITLLNNLNWKHKRTLFQGIESVYKNYLE